MKSSFAATFTNIAEGTKPKDRMFPSRNSVALITDENGAALPKESVLVLQPYNEFFGHTEKTSTLLVNNALRKEYENLHTEINASKASFLQTMKEQSGSKKALDKEIALAFTKSDDEEAFYLALARAGNELVDEKDAPFSDVAYDIVFDDKVLDMLGSKDFKTAIESYITRYNELIADSTYFKKGVFEYYNASQIAKTLADHGFFSAQHTITLNATEKVEITTRKQLEELVATELENITKDKELKSKFAELKKLFEKNVTLREFQSYLCSHELLLAQLANVALFKERVWKSYFKKHESIFNDLLDKYGKVKTRRKEIEESARKEQTQWEVAIDLFNDRFFVPFTLEAKNKVDVALGNKAMLDLGYTFKEGTDSATVDRTSLMQSLSTGEKKALYILNIIFEIEVRRRDSQETLFVVDDIADSFDYKNKYAIIQYLSEISESSGFKQIILTHNFDFFRTIQSRFVGYSSCLMATKTNVGIKLTPAVGIKNIFINDWKPSFFSDNKKRIACIPFMRNLIEYTLGESDPDYMKLTSLLHWKTDSASINQKTLDDIYRKLFPQATEVYPDATQPVIDLITQESQTCLTANAGANFENKIVLAIAIRLAAEKFMANKIANPAFLASISENQTSKLLKEFQRIQGANVVALKVLKNVVLMTPENIHLNAFMYEPILDMSDEHLRKLYTDVVGLT